MGLSPGYTDTIATMARNCGNLGIELFFVLSGYLIYGGLIRRAPPFRRFLARRMQRIYPAFLVVFATALALTISIPIPNRIPADPSMAVLFVAANLALLPGIFPIGRIVDVAWTLSYEAVFYVACPLLARAARRATVLPILAALFILLSCAGIPNFPIRMLPFFAGMLLAQGIGRDCPVWVMWATLLPAIAVSAENIFPPLLQEILYSAAGLALCAVCVRGAGATAAGMRWTPLRWLGNMSYSYYLTHGFVVRLFMLLLARCFPGGMPDWAFWTILPVLFGVTLPGAALLFAQVERRWSIRR